MSKITRPAAGNLTVLGEETEFEGVLEFTDNLIITGKVNGTIKSSGYLEISSCAECKVDTMTASTIIVSGTVTGNINAADKLEMNSGSRITGDVTTKHLCIADDVEFQGAVTMLDEVPEVDIFSMEAAEYKQQMTSTEKNDKEIEQL